MILTLERRRLIQRTPGQARSVKVLIPEESLPRLALADRDYRDVLVGEEVDPRVIGEIKKYGRWPGGPADE